MILFMALFVILTTETTRTLIEDFGAYGSILFASHPTSLLLGVVFLTALCTYYITIQHFSKTFSYGGNKKDLQDAQYDSEPLTPRVKSPTVRNQNLRPQNVGIVAMEVYFPSTVVKQTDLEVAYGVPSGKYVKGLGQEAMAFVGDREDINSISLTAVQTLLEKHNIPLNSIGRLEVGTESLIDKSKSTKTILMDLFKGSGNTDIEGVTTINACYGGSAALFNAVAWIESSNWNGKYALVVAADIAVYAEGSARPTGGCGAVALLVGPNATFVLEPGLRTTCASNVWDFYKPDPSSEYPVVDGVHSQACYLASLDDCYMRYCAKNELSGITRNGKFFDLRSVDYAVFHSPYNKLVQKSFARILYNDYLRNPSLPEFQELQKWKDISLDKSYYDRDLDLALRKISSDLYNTMTEPFCQTSKNLGNCYTASVFINLINLLDSQRCNLNGKRILMFTYGSGSMASMYSIRVRDATTCSLNDDSDKGNSDLGSSSFSLAYLAESIDLNKRLEQREFCTPEEYTQSMDLRKLMHGKNNYSPQDPVERLFPGTFYLKHMNSKFVREYERKPLSAIQKMGRTVEINFAHSPKAKSSDYPKQQDKKMHIAISGVSVGLPGSEYVEFGEKNMSNLLEGVNCISKISSSCQKDMLKKNVTQLKKSASGNTIIPVNTVENSIKLYATMGKLDLAKDYGIPQSLAKCMDEASQLAVAAGLEALKDAKLVDGKIENGWGHWRLAESLQDSTGIIFATSFPSLDGAIKEINRFSSSKENFEFDRKFLFRMLVLANAQLAQITGARGPNIQMNAACAGTTEAIGIAQDWISVGRCDRVVVIAADIASGNDLMPWIGSGFRALGAATLESDIEKAALPFDICRNGMLVGSGAVGLVLEKNASLLLKERAMSTSSSSRCRLIASQYSNSAFHGATLDQIHIAHEFNRFLQSVEKDYGIKRSEIAKNGIYFSHETFTNASPTTSCAYSEVCALKSAFGDDLKHLLIANTKGFTGHPMGVSFEDIAAVGSLSSGIVPPVVNFKVGDPVLGELNLSKGGRHNAKYALRFAAGFGSQIAFTLYGKSS